MKSAASSLLALAALAAVPATAQTAPAAARVAPTATAQAAPVAAQTAPAASAAGQLAGTVADSVSGQPLAFATVVLRPAAEPSRLLSTVADAQGSFRFEGLAAGRYTLDVQYLGYRRRPPLAVTVGAATQPVTLALAAAQHQLGEVQVTGTRPFIEQQADKLVLNVAASPLAAGGTAAELLARAPGVLEQGSGYQLRGKPVTVLLDGKLTNLGGDELKALLAALPANTLDRVELVANPGAKYDARAAAIVNLVTTKSLKLGTNGVASASVGAGRYGRYTAGLSLNHRTNRLNVYGGLDRLDNQVYSTSSSTRALDAETPLREAGQDVRRTQSNTLRLGFDLDLSKTTSVGVLAKGLLARRATTGSVLTELGGSQPQATLVGTEGTALTLSPTLNAYYKTTLAPGRTLRLSADYFGYAKNLRQDYRIQPDGTAASQLRQDSPARNQVRTLAADYTQSLYGGELEAGLKATFTTTDNDIRWEQAPAGQPWTVDASKTNHFLYQENIAAAYASYSRTVKKLSVQAGLRAEQTSTTGTSLTTGQATERRYLNLFPSLSLNYAQSEQVQLGLSYRRKIDRFQFGVVNPFVTYLSPYRYAQGNPAIRPSFSHNFEASYAYGSLLSAAVSYGYHTDVLVDSYSRDAATQVVTSSYQNFPSAHELNATLTLMKPLLAGKWQTVSTLGATLARVNGRPDLSTARPGAFLSSNHTLSLGHGVKAEASVMYMSPLTFGGVASAAVVYSSLGASKAVLKGAGTLTLSLSDPFNVQQRRYEVLAAGLNSLNVDKAESRFVKLSFSYKFGNQKVKTSQRRDLGTEAERARMND